MSKRSGAGEEIQFESIVDGLQKIYKDKILPVEQHHLFGDFHSPYLNDSDISAKPMVLLVGQYSTGKTRPEPTTDRFISVMHGNDEAVTPGNAAAVQTDKPFCGLAKFGTNFLAKFQVSQLPSSFLQNVTLIDTPGVLSGEKQRLGRSYDFTEVIEWFAERADRILFLFDAHKLDISDEFQSAMLAAAKGREDKIRVVLNKADAISAQQLMRVYGALMWSLGRCLKSPEVVRVYLGSFWDQPLQNSETKKLLETEMSDLMSDLASLPRYAAVRKLNELVKRARLAKVHALIIGHLKASMPSLFYKDSKQNEMIENLEDEFRKIRLANNLSAGDFPDVGPFKERLKLYNFSKNFHKVKPKMLDELDDAIAVAIPELMKRFPGLADEMALRTVPVVSNPFNENYNDKFADWDLYSSVEVEKYSELFKVLECPNGQLPGKEARNLLMESGLPKELLAKIWNLADMNQDGKLDMLEFAIAQHLIVVAKSGIDLPDNLPSSLIPPEKRR